MGYVPDEFKDQTSLLEIFRRRNKGQIRQAVMSGPAHVPPATLFGIRDAVENITRIKAYLASKGRPVPDCPEDTFDFSSYE